MRDVNINMCVCACVCECVIHESDCVWYTNICTHENRFLIQLTHLAMTNQVRLYISTYSL